MKISKLFHWLYAILMFLPIFFVVFGCIYAIHNNALDSNVNFFDLLSLSVERLNSNVLFSWASTSFLVAPFAYIGDLFGLPTNSPIITLLSYWLDISLIWLVFDVLMYVPLLVHRWLDKGIIE